MLAGGDGERLWSYWRQKLAPPLERLVLPTDHPRPIIQTFRGASLTFRLSSDAVRGIMTLARQARTTPFVGTASRVPGVAVQALRNRGRDCRHLHLCPEQVRIHADRGGLREHCADPRTPFSQPSVQRLHSTARGDRSGGDRDAGVSFAAADPAVTPRTQCRRLAIVQHILQSSAFPAVQGVCAAVRDTSDDVVQIGGLRLAPFPIEQGSGQFDLSLQMVEIDDGIRGAFKYNADLFAEATIHRFTNDFLAVIDTVMSDPDIKLGDVRKTAGVVAAPDDDVRRLLDQLALRDIRLSLDGDRLRINAPRGALDGELKATIAARRDESLRSCGCRRPTVPAHDAGAIRRIPRTGPLPVSAAQQRLWFLNQMDPGRAHYTIGGGLRLRGMLDIEVLQAGDPWSGGPARGVPHHHRRTRWPALADDIRDVDRARRCARFFGAAGRRATGRGAPRGRDIAAHALRHGPRAARCLSHPPSGG